MFGLGRAESMTNLRWGFRCRRLSGGPLAVPRRGVGRRLLPREPPSVRGRLAGLGSLHWRLRRAAILVSLPPSVQLQVSRCCGAISVEGGWSRTECRARFASAVRVETGFDRQAACTTASLILFRSTEL